MKNVWYVFFLYSCALHAGQNFSISQPAPKLFVLTGTFVNKKNGTVYATQKTYYSYTNGQIIQDKDNSTPEYTYCSEHKNQQPFTMEAFTYQEPSTVKMYHVYLALHCMKKNIAHLKIGYSRFQRDGNTREQDWNLYISDCSRTLEVGSKETYWLCGDNNLEIELTEHQSSFYGKQMLSRSDQQSNNNNNNRK